MRAFWTIFFLGSMFFVGMDVMGQRQSARQSPNMAIAGDAAGFPTPRP